MLNKIGKFYISQDLLRLDYEMVKKVLSKVVVVRCERQFHNHSFEYIAIGNPFDEIQTGEVPPTYTVTCDIKGEIKFERM